MKLVAVTPKYRGAYVDDRGIELAEAAVHELRTIGSSGLDSIDIDQALAALSAVRSLTKEED